MSVNNHRKCAKCGRTRAEDTTVTYHRFPNPGINNITKAQAWAKYCWPKRDLNSAKFLHSLYSTNKVLCGRHFSSIQFYDNNRQKLSKFAVPDSTEVEQLLNDRENLFYQKVEQSRVAGQITSPVSRSQIDNIQAAVFLIKPSKIDLNLKSSINKDINSEVPHNVNIESELDEPQAMDMESDSEVPDTTNTFTWQKPSEIIVSDDEELYIRNEITETVNKNNKNVTKSTCDINIRSENDLELQGDGNENTNPLQCQDYKCNVCNTPINGFRYRCVQCVDYDLCAACESCGAHERHYVLRIPVHRPYAEVENVLNRIRKELMVDMNNIVLFEDAAMLTRLKEEIVKDELEDPLYENETTENSGNDMDNDNMAERNDNMSEENDITHEESKEDNGIHISKSVPTESSPKVINITSLKRKRNESFTNLPIVYVDNIRQLLDSKKIKILPASTKQLSHNVISIQQHLGSNKTNTVKQLPVHFRTRPKRIAILKLPQKPLASNPSNVTHNLSQSLNVVTKTERHLLAEQLIGDKVPQVHLESLTTEEIDTAQDTHH